MSKDSIIDYLSYILFRLLGPLIRIFTADIALSLGRMLGSLLYCLDFKHKAIAYSNIKRALGSEFSPAQARRITKNFYRALGENLIEIFFIPRINKEYVNKYISIEGRDHINQGFKRGKGVILLGLHLGSWELSNVICANLGFSLSLLVRDQRHPRLNQLLNTYRQQKGCKVIQRQNQIRQLIWALKNNEAIGITVDQGGKTGTGVEFFGKEASMASGAVRMALKYDATLMPAVSARINGAYLKIYIEPPFILKKMPDKKREIQENLQQLTRIFERYILKYPEQYLWTYKIWKYTKEKEVLILSDAKTGHLRQAQAVGESIRNYFRDKAIATRISTVEIKFKNRFSRNALAFTSGFGSFLENLSSDKYCCQGCLWCLRRFLTKDIYHQLMSARPDIVISCGASVAPLNFIISRENLAKSIAIMRPSILSTKRFDLVIMPQHDRPPERKNVVVTEGAMNLINPDYLKDQLDKLRLTPDKLLAPPNGGVLPSAGTPNFYIGLLIGGDAQKFSLKETTVLEVIKQIKSACAKYDAFVLVTTSRRTSKEIDGLIRKEFADYPRCKLLIIANEKNIPEAIGAILALSQIIVTSPESISMVSEAASSQKYALVFHASGLSIKHGRFLRHFVKNKYIYLSAPEKLAKTIDELWRNKPDINIPRDNFMVSEAIKKIL
jgi:KDO2-lipid IV(A) lauroyltransferase